MKFWWPHNETIIATLLAWQLTVERPLPSASHAVVLLATARRDYPALTASPSDSKTI
jgi:hypothetical protein